MSRSASRRVSRRACAITARVTRACVVEAVESRLLFHVEALSEVADAALPVGGSTTVDLFENFVTEEAPTIVTFDTTQGEFRVRLLTAEAPRTAANFVRYVNSGAYRDTIIHRAITTPTPFVLQGGGFALPDLAHIPTTGRVANEFGRSNLRGTVAMAKVGSRPGSATSEFFVNLNNNAANLDNQNGGFTVFGEVIDNGMAAVDAIAALPQTTLAAPFPQLTDVPVVSTPADGPEDFVVINDVTIDTGLSYAVTVDNPALVTPAVQGTRLTLTGAAGQSGVANVTVRAANGLGQFAEQTFAVAVGTLDVNIGGATGVSSVTFTDADGTVGAVSLKGDTAAATVRFSGTSLGQSPGGRGVTVTGTGVLLQSIAATGTTDATALTINARGGSDKSVTVAGITADRGLRSLAGKQAAVEGDVVIGGAVGRVDLLSLRNGGLDVGGDLDVLPEPLGAVQAVINIPTIEDADILVDTVIRSLKVTNNTNADGVTDLVNAPAVLQLTATGAFAPDLELFSQVRPEQGNGLIRMISAKVGQLATGTWRVLAGSVGRVTAASAGGGWGARVDGGVALLAVRGDLTGDITAAGVRGLGVGGNYANSNLTLTQPFIPGSTAMSRLLVRGDMINVQIRSTNSLGLIAANSLTGSIIHAGVIDPGGAALPDAAADFPATTSIAGVTLRGRGGTAFSDSGIAASILGRLNLGQINLANGGEAFGVAADRILSLAAVGGSGNRIRLTNLNDPAGAAERVAALGDLQDFQIRVV